MNMAAAPQTNAYRSFNTKVKMPVYLLRSMVMRRSLVLLFLILPLQSAICAGRIKNASKSDAKSARHTTMGTTRINFPIIPGSSISGRNAAMVVRQAVKTGAKTSLVP